VGSRTWVEDLEMRKLSLVRDTGSDCLVCCFVAWSLQWLSYSMLLIVKPTILTYVQSP